jgi:hypothetical protein
LAGGVPPASFFSDDGGTTIDVSFVDSIARTPRGKVRTVIAMADSQSVTR